MSRISVFGLGLASKSPYVTAKGMQNMYAEQRPQGEKSVMVAYRTPGLSVFADSGALTPPRCTHSFDKTDSGFCVIGNVFYQVTGDGTLINRGTLLTFSGRISIADNGTQIMLVDGIYGYIYNTGTLTFTQITDPDFPANPQTVAFLSGYFVVTFNQSSRFYVSALYDGTSWDALSFANAETNPDPLMAVWAANGQLILLGSRSTEYWGASGTLDFPFAQIQGSATEWGLAAQFSVAKYDNSIACLIKNRMGQVMVAQLAGYLPKKISTPDIDAIINSYAVVSDAQAYSYMLGGHAMYVINFPTAGYSWLYDGSTGMWTSLKSYGITRHRANFGMSFLTFTIVADYALGILYKLTSTALTDNGALIESQIISETVVDPDMDRLTVNKFRVDMEVGDNASGYENPQIAVSISRDNGQTYGAEMFHPIGPIGNYTQVVEWNRLGTARNFVFKLRVSDPVPFCLVNAMVNSRD